MSNIRKPQPTQYNLRRTKAWVKKLLPPSELLSPHPPRYNLRSRAQYNISPQINNDINLNVISSRTSLFQGAESSNDLPTLLNLTYNLPRLDFYPHIPRDCPNFIKQICRRLQEAACFRPDKIVPQCFKNQVTREFPDETLPACLWDSDRDWVHPSITQEGNEEFDLAWEDWSQVKTLYRNMSKNNGVDDLEEVVWYAVEPALAFLRTPPRNQYPYKLKAMSCATNNVMTEFLPYSRNTGKTVQPTRVSKFIGYKLDNDPLASKFPFPLPLTPLQGIDQSFLGAIPIDVKDAAGDSTEAQYQLAICTSAMLRLRQLWSISQRKDHNVDKPPIVVALSVVGNIWSYYVMYLGRPQPNTGNIDTIPRILLGPFVAGHTSSLVSTFHLFHFLRVLREWLVTEWAPEVFEELAGIPDTLPLNMATLPHI